MSGRFTAAQREVYEIVLGAQRAALETVRAGRMERAARRRGQGPGAGHD